METQFSTTPFGRRPVTLGQIAAQLQVRHAAQDAAKPGSNVPAAVNKWQVFRTLTEVRERLGVSDRALSVLNALLSFHPETALTLPKPQVASAHPDDVTLSDGDRQTAESTPQTMQGSDTSCDLVVFPSNRQLTQRAHGMATATLGRHLAALVEAGLIIRRDSPNGKRYARKDLSGRERFSDAFGFELTPLVARAAEFEAIAEELRRLNKARQLVKERISLHRRDVGKLIACGLDEGLAGDWDSFRQRFLGLMTPLRSLKSDKEMERLLAELAVLHADVSKSLEMQINVHNMRSNAHQTEQHQSNSNTHPHQEFEPALKEAREREEGTADANLPDEDAKADPKSYPIGMVLEACPDVNDYKFTGGKVRTWPEFIETMQAIRPMLGISPSAWQEAIEFFGPIDAYIVLATILQRSEHSSEARAVPGAIEGTSVLTVNGSPAIKSAGGYLRALTEKARAGEFALGPVLMALIGQRLKGRRQRAPDVV